MHVFLHKFRVVELSRVYHTIPQSASKTKRTTDRSRWFFSAGGAGVIRDFTSQVLVSFRSALVGACLSGQRPSICSRRPFGHLKAPLGLSLLRKRGPTPNPARNVYDKLELVGARPLHLLSQTVRSLKSPTGAFIASQTRSHPKPCQERVRQTGTCRGKAPPSALADRSVT